MSMTDPLADLFVRIQNAGRRGHDLVQIPSSSVKKEVKKKSFEFLKKKGSFVTTRLLLDLMGIRFLRFRFDMLLVDRKNLLLLE